MTDSRNYNSPLRASQTEQTRVLILDTLAEMAAEDGFEGIIVNDLANRAGIAARTIYRHFPDRESLNDALADRIGELSGWTDGALGHKSDWPAVMQQAFRQFDTQEVASTVAARLNGIRTGTTPESTRRRAAFRGEVRAAYPKLSEEDVESVLAVVLLLGSSRTWLRLKEELGMPGERSGQIMRWVLELVLADLDARGAVPTFD